MKFWYSLSKERDKRIVTYKEVNGSIEKDKENSILWKFKKFKSYNELKNGSSPFYFIPNYNIMNGWKKREIKKELIPAVANDIFNACENYAKENKQFETIGWKQCAKIDKRKMQNIKKEAKLQSFSNILNYESGYKVPNMFSMH